MIIDGGSRSNWRFFSKHLLRSDTNESVRVVDIHGLGAEDLRGAFREMAAIADGTKCRNFFYIVSLNPREGEELTPEQWARAREIAAEKLGLEGQPGFAVEHFKDGRTHQHLVLSRIDAETMTAISDSLTYRKHEAASRQIESEFGLEPVESVLVKDRGTERPERRPKSEEVFRGKESGIDPQAMKAELTALWQECDSGRAFAAALEDAGYILARGDRRDFCIVDSAGHEHSLGRRLGVKAADIRARIGDINRGEIPSVDEARALARTAPEGDSSEPVSTQPGDRQEAEPTPPTIQDREEAPRGPNPDWVEAEPTPPTIQDREEAPRGPNPDWVEAEPTPPTIQDRQEAPRGPNPDWVEAEPTPPTATDRQEAPRGPGEGWRTLPAGQGSDQRPAYTAWESMAGRVRGYWERLGQFLHDEGGTPAPQPEAQAPDTNSATPATAKSWLQRVKDSKAAQTAARVLHGWGHRDGVEMVEGITDAAMLARDAIAPRRFPTDREDAFAKAIKDTTAEGPRPPGADVAPPAGRPMTALERLAARAEGKPLSDSKPMTALERLAARAAQQEAAAPDGGTQPEEGQPPPATPPQRSPEQEL